MVNGGEFAPNTKSVTKTKARKMPAFLDKESAQTYATAQTIMSKRRSRQRFVCHSWKSNRRDCLIV